MIWHFFEVWVVMLAAFAIGCPIGATAYKLIAQSPLAALQGDFADVVGDVVDGIKSRLGIGPVWRPEYRRLIEHPPADAEGMDDHGSFSTSISGAQAAQRQDRLLPGGPLMIADQSDRSHDDEPAGQGATGRALAIAAAIGADESAASQGTPMARPVALAAPRNGVPDDLQRIRGIGSRIEQRLNALGIFHFGQIAAWTPAEMRWVAQQLAFPDRLDRDDWIGQAIVLASGGNTGFAKSAERRRARRRQMPFGESAEGEAGDDDTIDLENEEAIADGTEAEGETA